MVKLNKKSILSIVLTLIVLTSLALTGCGSKETDTTTTTTPDTSSTTTTTKPTEDVKPFKIGTTQALSGSWAKYGEDQKIATELAVDEINAAGGILGRPVEIIFRDDQANPEISLRNAKDLVLTEKVDVLLGPNSTACVLAVSMYAKEQKILHFGVNSGEATTTANGHRYHFRLSTTSYYVGTSTAYAADHFFPDAKKWAVLMPDYEYGHSLAEGFWETYSTINPDAELVGEFWYPHPDCSDFSPYISKVLASGADAVYQAMTGSAVAIFTKQSAGFDYHERIKVISAEYGQPELTQGLGDVSASLNGAVGGAYYPFWHFSDETNQNFVDSYYERAGIYPGCVGANAYYGIYMLKEVIEELGEWDTEKVIDALEGRMVPTFAGEKMMRACDHNLFVPYFYSYMTYDESKWPFPYLRSDTMWYLDPEEGNRSCEEVMSLREQ